MKYVVGIIGIFLCVCVIIDRINKIIQSIRRRRTPLTVEGARHAKKAK